MAVARAGKAEAWQGRFQGLSCMVKVRAKARAQGPGQRLRGRTEAKAWSLGLRMPEARVDP